jgi:hypothetical protein
MYGSAEFEYKPLKNVNLDLTDTLFNKGFYSSWCKVYTYTYNKMPHKYLISSQTNTTRKTSFAFINCFFRVRLPNDKLINNLPIASITIHDEEKDKFNYHNYNSTCNLKMFLLTNNYNDSNIFTSIYNIFSTPILTVPFIKYKRLLSNKTYKTMVEPILEVDEVLISILKGTNENNDFVLVYGYLMLLSLFRERECIHSNNKIFKKIHPYFNKKSYENFTNNYNELNTKYKNNTILDTNNNIIENETIETNPVVVDINMKNKHKPSYEELEKIIEELNLKLMLMNSTI